ncbi:hypothetical protein VTK26DRAFT_9214 [Humicola hyalothermophila]
MWHLARGVRDTSASATHLSPPSILPSPLTHAGSMAKRASPSASAVSGVTGTSESCGWQRPSMSSQTGVMRR